MKKLIAGVVIAVSQVVYILVYLRIFFAFPSSRIYNIFTSLTLYATLILFIARIILWFVKPNNKFYWLYFVGMVLAFARIITGGLDFNSFIQNVNMLSFAFLLPIADSFITDFAISRSPSAQTQKQKEIERLKEKIKKLEE